MGVTGMNHGQLALVFFFSFLKKSVLIYKWIGFVADSSNRNFDLEEISHLCAVRLMVDHLPAYQAIKWIPKSTRNWE